VVSYLSSIIDKLADFFGYFQPHHVHKGLFFFMFSTLFDCFEKELAGLLEMEMRVCVCCFGNVLKTDRKPCQTINNALNVILYCTILL